MRVDIRPRKAKANRPAWKIAAAYLQWLRGRKCAVAGKQCWGKIEAAHTPDPDSKGMGTKAADFHAVPLCHFHHARQHIVGWKTFLAEHRIKDLDEWRRAYWRAWPGHREWVQEIEHGRH